MMRSDEIETIQSIKDKTRYYIEQCSPESNIRYTDYFNHTFIPDMVIDWNKQERYLYIRTTSGSARRFAHLGSCPSMGR